MVQCYIALGSNIGDRLLTLKRAIRYLSMHPSIVMLHISPVYETPALLPDNAPADWDIAFLNQVVAIETTLSPLPLLELLKGCEQYLGRKNRGHWGPREIDCDLLLYGNEIIESDLLRVPHPRMCQRRFVLQPLVDIAAEVEIHGKAAAAWLAELPENSDVHRYHTSPGLVGILNLTPDSFSDGGRYTTTEKALHQLQALLNDGAGIVDVGAESTRPGARSMSWEEEWERLSVFLQAVARQYPTRAWMLSVDTYHPETAQRALDAGADWINDVCAFSDPRMLSVVKETPATLVCMHSLTVPADPSVTLAGNVDVVGEIVLWAIRTLRRLEKEGIGRDKVILDPGIGFGKTALQSLSLMNRATELTAAIPDVRWLYGHSRKSFMKLLGADAPADRDMLTLAYSAQLANAGVAFLRVHNAAHHKSLLQDMMRG